MQEHLVDHSNFLETQQNFLERKNRGVAQVAHVETSSQERKSTFVEGTSTSYQEGIEIEDGAEREVGADCDADSNFVDNHYRKNVLCRDPKFLPRAKTRALGKEMAVGK